MSVTNPENPSADDLTGHRERLRQRFMSDQAALSPGERVELLLSYAIARRDVAPLAEVLLRRFGGITGLVRASVADLLMIDGVGERTALLIALVGRFASDNANDPADTETDQAQEVPVERQQDLLPDSLPATLPEDPSVPAMRTFANDEVANALEFLPQAARFDSVDTFRDFLQQRLPYNAEATRQRRAKYIVDRFLPEGRLDVPLVYYTSQYAGTDDLKPVLFYHMLRAEPLAAAIAEELVWPALALGSVDRQQIREVVLRHLPELSPSSQAKVLQSIFNTYALLGVARRDGDVLRLRVRPGTLASFNYLLAAECPRPGVYTFDELEIGRLRRWLLWDRAWMTRQLYHLEQLGILAKVSEIDTVRQFTVQFDQATALRVFFQHPLRAQLAVRETAELADVDVEAP